MRQIKTASVFEYLLVHCSLFKFDDKMNWISGVFFLRYDLSITNECIVNVLTNGDGSHCSELSLSTGLCFRVASLFRDTLEIKFTRNSAYFVPGALGIVTNEFCASS